MNEVPQPRRRRWRRWLTQFSLRSLLILTTLAAGGCWWFLRPASRDEELAGQHLKLRRQVRIEGAKSEFPQITSIGTWRVRDQHGDLVIDGRCADNQPHGPWTIYHPSGRKAAEGQVFCGARTGLWRTWDEEGRLRSEATYKAVERMQRRPPPMRPFVTGPLPIVGMIDLIGQLAPPGGSLMGGSGLAFRQALPQWEATHVAVRHGPVKVWYASGQLQLEGAYRDDRRDGQWTYCDEQGRITQQGTYAAGVRHGTWTTLQAQEHFVGNLSKDERAALLTRLEADLTGDSISRKIAAAQRLEELGPAGAQPAASITVPILTAALDSDDLETRLLALRSLGRQPNLPDEAARQIAALADHSNPRIALRARLALYVAQPGERERLFASLFTALEAAGDALAIEGLLAIYRADPERRLIVLAALIERMGRAEVAFQDGLSESSPEHVERVADFGWDVIPELEAIYSQSSPDARWFAVLVLSDLVARGRARLVPPTATSTGEFRWEIPAQGQPLLNRARADADPRVQETAERVGMQEYYGGGGFF